MHLNEIEEKIAKIKIENQSKKAILELIDLKTNSDMRQVIAEMKSLKSEIKNEVKIIYWVVGSAMALITILLGIIGFLIAFKK